MTYFEVPGPFGVKGSTFSFMDRRGVIRTKTDCKHGASFARAVQAAALRAGVSMVPAGRAVSVSVLYGFLRPQRCDRVYPSVRPDIDKLVRALLDALTGVAYQDDGQVIALASRKIYTDRVSARVVIREETHEDDPLIEWPPAPDGCDPIDTRPPSARGTGHARVSR